MSQQQSITKFITRRSARGESKPRVAEEAAPSPTKSRSRNAPSPLKKESSTVQPPKVEESKVITPRKSSRQISKTEPEPKSEKKKDIHLPSPKKVGPNSRTDKGTKVSNTETAKASPA